MYLKYPTQHFTLIFASWYANGKVITVYHFDNVILRAYVTEQRTLGFLGKLTEKPSQEWSVFTKIKESREATSSL